MRVRGIVAYDGSGYSGFQRQVNALTVQEVLEDALTQVTQEVISLLAAGRTDAGVHATGQVVAFDTTWRHELKDLWRALNAVLPADVAFLKLEQSAVDFHPRYGASCRCYCYSIYNAPVRNPLALRYSLHKSVALDVSAMQHAAGCLVGEHDFATFGQPSRPQGSTVRKIVRAEWRGEIPHLFFDIEANAFLYRMVRSIVGTLLQVGQGKLSVNEFRNAFISCDRSQAGPTAPPQGLCLVRVKYD
jgi:tRNA pseudouridine38-40 synthase